MMKRNVCVLVAAALIGTLVPAAAWSQRVGETINGKITQEGQPFANGQVVITNTESGRTFKTKSDKKGEFSFVGIPSGAYELKVFNPAGALMHRNPNVGVGTGNTTAETIMTIAVPKDPIPDDTPAPGPKGKPAPAPKMTKEQIKAEEEKTATLNGFLQQVQAAMRAQNWPDVETAMTKLLALDSASTRWDLYKVLGDAQFRQNKLQEAIKTYDTAIQMAQAVAAGTAAKDPRNPNPDPAKAKAGAGQMMASEANAYLKLGKQDEALELFKKSAETDPSPALAWYNLCALQFNAHKYDDAAAACDKSVTADPNKADAWFFKGAALNKAGKTGAPDALNKYLQLDPSGSHVAEAKAMLSTGGQK